MGKRIAITSMLVAAVGLAGCDLTAPTFNDPSVEDLTANPTAENVAIASQGLLRGTRTNAADMVQWAGMYGREGYRMQPTGSALPGSVRDPMNGSTYPGNVLWGAPFQNLRNAFILLRMVDGAGTLTEGEKEAVRGFAKTIMAYDFLQVIVTRDQFGAPIDLDRDPTDDPAPFVSREAVYDHIARLLDEGYAHLQGSNSFPFRFPTLLAHFGTPASFATLNRALRARVAVYTEDWTGALAALSGSFMDRGQPLEFGAWHGFSTSSGDATNPVFRDDLYAHSRLRSEAQLRSDGTPDLRFQRKTTPATPISLLGIESDLRFTHYDNPAAPVPWIRNEELILLRAEANLALGNTAEALDDINFIRTESGGLEPLPAEYAGDLWEELLYNRRYSLIWEGGHTWIDMRRHGRLLEIPVTPADPRLFDALPVHSTECLARDPQPAGCGTIEGFMP